MNAISTYSATIEQMRIERNVPTFENRKAWSPSPIRQMKPPLKIHPRVHRLRKAIRKYLGLRNATEIHAVTEEIQTLLWRCLYHLRGERALRAERRQQARVRRRVRQSGAPRQRAGRPVGSVKLAALQLELGVAQIWFEITGRWPTRRFDAVAEQDYGPFHEFMKAIRSILPRALLVRRKGNVPKIDHGVRKGIAELREAQDAREEYRHRGLINESRWLSTLSD